MSIGTLFGIGVGPGDPDLITLKAMNTLKGVDVVFAAASTTNSHSLAEKIVTPHLRNGVTIKRLNFPMTRDRNVLDAAWQENAEIVIKTLKKGQDAALITLGDPLTYSTFGYVMAKIRETTEGIPIKIIPGITSYQAGSASAGVILAEGEESFTVISGALGSENLKKVIESTDTVVMLKVYRNYKEIFDTLDELDLTDRSVLISKCGLEGEEVFQDIKERPDNLPPYLSLLLIKKKNSG
jgi:precorrin-2/cobalt-factor-2 C20-methyltransferase